MIDPEQLAKQVVSTVPQKIIEKPRVPFNNCHMWTLFSDDPMMLCAMCNQFSRERKVIATQTILRGNTFYAFIYFQPNDEDLTSGKYMKSD